MKALLTPFLLIVDVSMAVAIISFSRAFLGVIVLGILACFLSRILVVIAEGAR